MDLGIKLGKNFHRNKFGGLEVGLLNNPLKEFYGVQIGIGNDVAQGKGVQIGVANINIDIGGGMPAGDYDFSGVQISGNNHQDGKVNGLQVAVMTNIVKEMGGGVQLSLGANMIEPYLSGESKAVQVGLANFCISRLIGAQIGIFCYAEKGKFLQLGLLTMRGGEKPWYLRVTPFVGYSNNMHC